jgi:hypothetical protein
MALQTSIFLRQQLHCNRGTVFTVLFVPRYYKQGSDRRISPRVEAGSNTSTVTLRNVVGDENRTQCLGV